MLSGMDVLSTRDSLIVAAAALAAEHADALTAEESRIVDGCDAPSPSRSDLAEIRELIRAGRDPLGTAYCRVHSAELRRPLGQTYTSREIVEAMTAWAAANGSPTRVVDPGAGSGRYLLAAAKSFPEARLFGVDVDPLAALMLRANLAACGLADRAEVRVSDFRTLSLPPADGSTLFLGNPPYVRHHSIPPEWKEWFAVTAKRHGLKASKLAGLHVHFFLATAEHARPGDYGAFITSSEWLDVNYGKLVRDLLLDGLGGQSLHLIDASVFPFDDVATTGMITCFKIGDSPAAVKLRRVRSVGQLGRLEGGRGVSRKRLAASDKWSVLTRPSPKLPEGYVELGELCRVHRGAVTGANRVWVRRGAASDLPERVLFPSVTKARELFAAGKRLTSGEGLRNVIDLPWDLDVFDAEERRQIDKFLREAQLKGVDKGYIAANRKAWWSVGLRDAAPILATYMARRPPAFVRNDIDARHINIAHGVYPRTPMSPALLDRLADALRASVNLSQGRTYAGGLVKFEPREMERIPVPNLDRLAEGTEP